MGLIDEYINPYLLLLIFIVSLPLIYPNFFWGFYHTYRRDGRALVRYVRFRLRTRRISSRGLGIPSIFQEVTAKDPNKVAIFFEDEKWTFRELDEYSNKIANYFKGQGVKHGDCIALFMENRVEYIGIWLGLAKLGAVPALLNYNLRLKGLAHCIKIVNAKQVICASQDQKVISDVLQDDLKLHVQGVTPELAVSISGAVDLDSGLESMSIETPPEISSVKFTDLLFYMYTSGTTGLPKGAVIKHSRAIYAALGAYCMMDFNPSDVVYSPLPLYHLVSGIMGVGQALCAGLPVVLRRNYSSVNYWTDCIKYRVTYHWKERIRFT